MGNEHNERNEHFTRLELDNAKRMLYAFIHRRIVLFWLALLFVKHEYWVYEPVQPIERSDNLFIIITINGIWWESDVSQQCQSTHDNTFLE